MTDERQFDGEQFLVAADGARPVRARCARCRELSPPFGDGGREPPMAELGRWAGAHACSPALSADAWAAGGDAVQEYLKLRGISVTMDDGVKAFASALQAVWEDVRRAAAG